MNTPPTPQGCIVNSEYCRVGAQTLLNLLEGIDDLIEGVIHNPDIKYVHKTRVSSRRLRVTLLLFEICFSKKEYKTWTKNLKEVMRLLSKARDLDVQINFVEEYLKKLDSNTGNTGLNALLVEHKNRRKNLQPSVIAGLEKLKASQTLTKIRAYCENLTSQQPAVDRDIGPMIQSAHHNISLKLAELLSMERYVYLDNEPIGHHQMRIYAKKLRYTMECFAFLYENKLEFEIQQIKTFQDTLGEVHDCDVWLKYIKQFTQKQHKKTNKATKNPELISDQSLKIFTTYIGNRREKYYHQFVDCWNQSMDSGFFDKLTDKTSQRLLVASQKKTYQTLTKPNVKIAVLSDIHANLPALQKVLQDAERRGADIFVNAGDSVGFGACPNEVIELLCEKGILSIAGNDDLTILKNQNDAKGTRKTTFKYTKKHLSKASENYLKLLPKELRLEAGGKQLFVTHGNSPSINEHLYPNTDPKKLQHLSKIADADVVIIGYSHIQFQREVGKTVFINPGSIGRPGDKNPQTAYALLSFNPFRVELIRLPYDIETTVYDMRKRGLPESFAQMLLCGVSIDTVVKDDKAKKATIETNCSVVAAACEQFSGDLWPIAHCRQVTSLAIALFEGLASVHKLGKQERCWLECAALLHDVGLSKTQKKHNKESMKLILNDTQLPLPSKERRIIASIARYHRGGLPKRRHYNLASLDRKSLHSICVLAALLRVADSLDYRHESSVKKLSVRAHAKKITVETIAEGDSLLEIPQFNKKKDLFEKIFKKDLVLIWHQQ